MQFPHVWRQCSALKPPSVGKTSKGDAAESRSPMRGTITEGELAARVLAAEERARGYAAPAGPDAALKATIDKYPDYLVRHGGGTAAIDMGLTQEPIVVVDVSKVDAMILNEALNRIHGTWDEPALALHQEEIRLSGGDLSLTGFTPAEINMLRSGRRLSGQVVEPPTPEPPETAVTQVGDVWALGVTLWEFLAGKQSRVKNQKTSKALSARIQKSKFYDADPELEALIKRMVSVDPTDRPTAAQLVG